MVVPAVFESTCLLLVCLHLTVYNTHVPYLMERPKHRPRAQRLTMLSKYLLCCLRTIHYQHRYISELDLVDIAMYFRPLSILLGCIDFDVWDIAYERPVPRSCEPFDSDRISCIFVDEEVGEWNTEKDKDEGAEGMVVEL
jgi:hypothetical protein